MSADEKLFIDHVDMIKIDENINIPTVLYYENDGSFKIGYDALNHCPDRRKLNENFKVDLGNVDPTKSRLFATNITAQGERKSAAALSLDFFNKLLQGINSFLDDSGLARTDSIIIAEPLSIQTGLVENGWLSNYRNNIEKYLENKGFKNINFLPEPFAVFQYYRYGKKLSTVSGNQVYRVLVIDFGGGTFDVCVVETTQKGDIKEKGKNSIPIGAASEAVGGAYVNQMLLEELLINNSKNTFEQREIKRSLDIYKRYKKDYGIYNSLEKKFRNFIDKFVYAIHSIEPAKVALTNFITNWNLDFIPDKNVPVTLPSNMFDDNFELTNFNLSANIFKSVFEKKIWNEKLRSIVKLSLERADVEMDGAPVSNVLLSGGSANIGWLRELISRDFYDKLGNISIIRLKNFQEVVAQGLAVECVRRFYTSGGDFASITYNTLCLLLNPDDKGLEINEYKSMVSGLTIENKPGVLLPTATILKKMYNIPLRWKTKLKYPPKNSLQYFFLRNSLDVNDINNLQNLDHKVETPTKYSFDTFTKIELLVKEDGTAFPKFIYKTLDAKSEEFVEGKPFFLDMTFSAKESVSKCYLGVDFGTSNTSVSYVTQDNVEKIIERNSRNGWNDLVDAVNILPYPLANPLAVYIRATDQEKLNLAARQFIEAALSLIAYSIYLDYCSSTKNINSKYFKNFTQRSAGPLWALIKAIIQLLTKDSLLQKYSKEILLTSNFQKIDEAVNYIAKDKHDKNNESDKDLSSVIRIFTNICCKMFSEVLFGIFENVKREKFSTSCKGKFTLAQGNPQFIQNYLYTGEEPYSNNFAYLIDYQKKRGLNLFPLVFWDQCTKHPENPNGHCYIFDRIERNGDISFISVGYLCPKIITSTDADYQEIFKMVTDLKNKDTQINLEDIEIFQN